MASIVVNSLGTLGVRTPVSRWAKPISSIDSLWAPGSINAPPFASLGGAVWPSANLIIYVPVAVRTWVIAKKLWFASDTVGTGNIDIGIYSRAGSRLVNSGTIAHGTANDEKTVDITDTTLKPDLYYIALQGSNGTDTYTRSAPGLPVPAASGVRSEAAGGFGLPASATWTVPNTLNFSPIVGILQETTL
jgi:hypothetical protein